MTLLVALFLTLIFSLFLLIAFMVRHICGRFSADMGYCRAL